MGGEERRVDGGRGSLGVNSCGFEAMYGVAEEPSCKQPFPRA